MIYRKKDIVYKVKITKLLLFLLEIAGYDSKGSDDFEKSIMKRLKFQKLTDWKKFRACVDLLDDTEYALISFFKYQLGDLKNKNNDFGELYLRLYGILNAVYLQMRAFKEIAKLLNYPERDSVPKNFEKLDIYKLRGIAGAHTADYMYDNKILSIQKNIKKITSFRIIQMNLDKKGSKITALDENNITFEFNLLDCLYEYEDKATKLLIDLVNHSINTLVNRRDTKVEMRRRLDKLLPDLIDYRTLNENLKHEIRERKRWKKMVDKLKGEKDEN